jgi:hypothetical protein
MNVPLTFAESDANADGALFQSSWWLDAASGCPCDSVSVTWNGDVVGTLHFHRSRRLGMTRLRMPPFTRTLSPCIRPPQSKPAQRLVNTRRIVQDMIRALPPHDMFDFALDAAESPAIAFAFEQAGADIGQTFTFRTTASHKAAAIWSGLDQKTRNVVRSASTRCSAPGPGSFDQFAAIYRAEHGARSRDSLQALRRLHDASVGRGQAAIRVTSDDRGDVAGTFLVWDRSILYLLATARLHSGPNGANALMLWDAIQFAEQLSLLLDLDGYKTRASARFLSSFGLALTPRVVVRRRSLRYRIAEWGHETLAVV